MAVEESVFAIPTGTLWNLLTYKEKGLIRGNSGILGSIIQKGIFRKRGELEEDPSFKQLIPYAIISHQNSFFLFKRTSGQAEKRLHNKLHLGLGGHMNPGEADQSSEQYLVNELKREFFEEVRLSNGCRIERIEFIGFINDDTIPVGRVHIGLLHHIHLSNKDMTINEPGKMTANWVTKADLAELGDALETWTSIAIEHYIN